MDISILNYYIEPARILQLLQYVLWDFRLLPSLSIYLHMPFCSTICTYCAFNTYIDQENLIDPFIDALLQEIIITASGATTHSIGSSFFGGGTPSLLTINQFDRIMNMLDAHLNLESEAETSLEANPNDLSLSYLQELKALGFNRISIGMQSAHPRDLQLFDRQHDLPTVVSAVKAARRANFDNLNLDLIFGIPDQTIDDWKNTLVEALALEPTHLSLYELELKGGTRLQEQVEIGEVSKPDDDLSADMYDLTTEMLVAAGYEQYEISNWCLPGYECRHNLQYWRNLPYVGLGPGAHGFANGVRYSTMLLPQRYIDALSLTEKQHAFDFPHTPAVAKATNVSREQEIAETLMMGLRLTREGIQRGVFAERFGADVVDLHQQTVEKFMQLDLLHVDDDVLRLTEKGYLLSNAVIREFI